MVSNRSEADQARLRVILDLFVLYRISSLTFFALIHKANRNRPLTEIGEKTDDKVSISRAGLCGLRVVRVSYVFLMESDNWWHSDGPYFDYNLARRGRPNRSILTESFREGGREGEREMMHII